MSSFLLFLIVGLGTGAAYVALAQGVVVVYKATGVISVAQGGIAAWGAFTFAELRKSGDLVLPAGRIHVGSAMWTSLVLGVGVAAVTGLLAHVLVFRQLRSAPALAKVVASVGLMLTLQVATLLRFGEDSRAVDALLPNDLVVVNGVAVASGRLYMAGTAVLLTALLWAYFRFSRLGLATRAAAESDVHASLSGYSPDLLAGSAWLLSSAFSGLMVILASSATGLTSSNYIFYIVPALAVALVGRLRSVGIVCVAGFVLAGIQSELSLLRTKLWWPDWAGPGLADVVPFLVIVVSLFLAGRSLPSRGDEEADRLPQVHRPANRPVVVALASLAGLIAVLTTQGSFRFAVVTSMIMAILGLSYVLLTGFVGQISLAQLAFAGAAGFTLSRLTSGAGVPFPLAVLLSSLASAGLGVLVGIPALRIRGAQLAVVTLAGAVAIEQFVFSNPSLSPPTGNPISDPSLFGIDLGIRRGAELVRLPFAVMVLVLLVVLTVAVGNLLRGYTGRVFLAVRSNERAAAAVGIDLAATKLVAFALSSFVAGTGGCLIGYSRGQLSTASFAVISGLALLAVAYLSGITSVSGAMIAGLSAPLGLANVFFDRVFHFRGDWWLLLSGIGLMITVILNPQGIAGQVRAGNARLVEKIKARRIPSPEVAR
ncbi:ABC transporter permease [Kribbella sp. NPDC051586]|uniref:ABC transporter permease n=1 Tax=Kribbella sp. NPDC051586 TaxID=3364118 RepID=UPI0037A90686